MTSRASQLHFDVEAAAVNNHRMGNLNMCRMPAQLRAVYAEIVKAGEDPAAMVTMTQQMYADMMRRAPATVTYPPIAYSFTAQASQRAKTF